MSSTASLNAAADCHTQDANARPGAVPADAIVDLGRLVLRFGRTYRITLHDDGTTPESDTDHTVMLALIACALAPTVDTRLDMGLVGQYALVHDLVGCRCGPSNSSETKLCPWLPVACMGVVQGCRWLAEPARPAGSGLARGGHAGRVRFR
jgi:hypothetical protein